MTIGSKNCLTAWRDACNHMLNDGDGYNLLMRIESPLAFTDRDLEEITGSGLISAATISDVTNTIFPYKLFRRQRRRARTSFYDMHEEIYERGKTMHAKNRSRWGTYFLRFTKFGSQKINQLHRIVDAIKTREKNQKACYIMHVSSVDYDNNTRVIGNPCLQYVQFGEYDEALHLTAVYRNHDFDQKALGNYIGLARLLEYVCLETGLSVGTLTCHSIHYYLPRKRAIGQCIAGLTW